MSTRSDEGVCTITVHGEADLATADELLRLGQVGLDDQATTKLVLDLRDVTFIDSTVISTFVQLRRAALSSRRAFELAELPDRVRRVLDITGLTSVFESPES